MRIKRLVALVGCLMVAFGIQASVAGAADPWVHPTGPVLQPSNPEWPTDPGFQNDGERALWGQMPGNCDGLTPKVDGSGSTPRPDGGLPCRNPNAVDPEGAPGINATGAWAQGNTGREDVLLAYIEGGVNYSSNGIRDVIRNVFLNEGELPYPQGLDGQDLGRYDFNGDGRFNIEDWIDDPRVNPNCGANPEPGTGGIHQDGVWRTCIDGGQHDYLHKVTIGGAKTAYLSPDDLIAVFGKCKITNGQIDECPADGRFDNDGNGYPNDISGWNAYHNTNDPQTENLNYDHASNLMRDMAAARNNGFAGVGICPECTVIPIKSGAESVGKADGLAPAITYAADIGATAVSSVVVSYAYSSALAEAVKYANKKGVIMSMDSNDFDSMDHTDGHLFPDVFPGNGLVEAKVGGQSSGDVQTYRGRGTVTSYGTHSIFSGNSATTSGATPFQAAFMALAQSASRDAAEDPANPYERELTTNELKQVLINTVSPITPEVDYPQIERQWPGNPDSKTDATHSNWSTQYGYGRPNIGRATKLIKDGKVPPTARITSPEWYRYVDPARQDELQVKGEVAPSAWGSQGLNWVLEWAYGADPADSDFETVATGTEAKSGVLGTIDLKQMRDYAKKNPGNTLPLSDAGPEQYTVSIRLRARDGNDLKGEDRRSFGARTDADLVKGFPKATGTEVSASPAFYDLRGRGQLDLVFGTHDGQIHAIGPDGKQAPNFPLQTGMLKDVDANMPQNFASEAYQANSTLREARDPVSGVAVGDLEGKGDISVVATTFSGWTYAWSATTGKLRPGFPTQSDEQYFTLPSPTPPSAGNGHRSPIRGNWSAPVLANLAGDGTLSILVTSYDGHLYAFDSKGETVPGWPVEVTLPAADVASIPANKWVRDPKLITPPAVGDVLGTGTDQVFLPAYDCHDESTGGVYLYGLKSDGTFMDGWPTPSIGMAGCYQESIDFVQEGGNAPAIADFDNSGTVRVAFTPAGGFTRILNADGTLHRQMEPTCKSTTCAGIPPYYLPDSLTIGLTTQMAVGDMTGDGVPNLAQPQAGGISLLQAFDAKGTALLAHVYDTVWNTQDGKQLDGFPTDQDGFPFYSSPLIVPVNNSNERAMITSNDSYWIHGRLPNGSEAPGFPKWTGQWTSFNGVVGDAKLNDQQFLAYGSREGQIFMWKIGGKADRNDQWWKYRHDEHNSGNYARDTRPPAGAKLKVQKRTGKQAVIRWQATGDNGVSNGKVSQVQVFRFNKRITAANLNKAKRMGTVKPANPGKVQRAKVKVTKKAVWVAVRFKDAAGNWSQPSAVKVGKYNPKPAIKKCRKQFKKAKRNAKGNKKKIKRLKQKRNRCIKKARRG